jgi:hypothetical protein
MQKALKTLGLSVALAVTTSLNLAEAKSMARVKVPENFDYAMVRPIHVAIDIAGPAQGFSGLSFYTQAPKSKLLRLLDSGVSDANGHYTGSLAVPSYVKNIVVAARLQNFRGLKKLSIKRDGGLLGVVNVK